MLRLLFKFIWTCLLLLNNQAYATKQTQIDTLLSEWHNKEQPGLAVAVNLEGQTVYETYHGLADLEHRNPINQDTKFLIASVSKQFTAFAIALLAEEKQLSFNDDIRKYIPELPEYEWPIKIIHLLNHTSGLRDADDLNSIIGAGLSDYVSFNDVYKLITQQTNLNFKPGSQFDYSNSGYILMAKIVENISGLSFREFMNKHVFEPLEMQDTLVFDNPFEIIGNKATAYFSNDGLTHSKNNLFSSVYGSTGMYTTLKDLNQWAINFTTHQVGNQAIFDQMKTQGVLNDGEIISYALGQELKDHNGHQAIFHGGGQGAYRAYLLRFPESKLSVTLLSNNSYSTSFIVDYAYQIADLFLEKKSANTTAKTNNTPSEFAPVQVDKSTLQKYVGDYQIQPGLIFSLKLNQDDLELYITGQSEAIPLAAINEKEFVLMDSENGYRIIFKEEIELQADYFNYYQFDMEYIAKRVNLVEFNLQEINWKELEGLYFSEELNTLYSLKFDGKKFIAHHARNLPINFTPHQPDVFYGDATFFQEIKFIRDEEQQISGMLVSGSRSKNINFIKLTQKQ